MKYRSWSWNEPVHNKTYNKTCVTSKDSDLPVHPSSTEWVIVYPSLDSLEAVEGMCNQWRFCPDCGCAGWSGSLLVTQVFLSCAGSNHTTVFESQLTLKLPITTIVVCFDICLWFYKLFLQTVWTQIRLLLYEQSDQRPHHLTVC